MYRTCYCLQKLYESHTDAPVIINLVDLTDHRLEKYQGQVPLCQTSLCEQIFRIRADFLQIRHVQTNRRPGKLLRGLRVVQCLEKVLIRLQDVVNRLLPEVLLAPGLGIRG